MLDSVIKSKDVISMAEERCGEADVSCLFVLVSAFFACYRLICAFNGALKARRSGYDVVLRSLAFHQCDLRPIPAWYFNREAFPGAPFMKVPVVTGAEKLLLFAVFTFKNSTEIQPMNPSGIEKGRLVF